MHNDSFCDLLTFDFSLAYTYVVSFIDISAISKGIVYTRDLIPPCELQVVSTLSYVTLMVVTSKILASMLYQERNKNR